MAEPPCPPQPSLERDPSTEKLRDGWAASSLVPSQELAGARGDPPAAAPHPSPPHGAAPSQRGFPRAPSPARAWHRSPSAELARGLSQGSAGSCHPSAPPQRTWGPNGTKCWGWGNACPGHSLSIAFPSPPRPRHRVTLHKVNKIPVTQQHLGEMLPTAAGGTHIPLAQRSVLQSGGCGFSLVLPAQSSLICSRSNCSLFKHSSRKRKSAELSCWCTQQFHNHPD